MWCLFLVFLGFQNVASFKVLPEELVFRFRGLPSEWSNSRSVPKVNQLRHAPAPSVSLMQELSPSFGHTSHHPHALPYKPPPALIVLLCFGLGVLAAAVMIICSSFRRSEKKNQEPSLQHIGRGNEAEDVLGSIHANAGSKDAQGRAPSKSKANRPSSHINFIPPDNSALIAAPRRPTPSTIAAHTRAPAEDLDLLLNPVPSAPTSFLPIPPPTATTAQNFNIATPVPSMDTSMLQSAIPQVQEISIATPAGSMNSAMINTDGPPAFAPATAGPAMIRSVSPRATA